MRVHLKNVVHSAVERGIVVGYHRLNKLAKTQQHDDHVRVDTMLKSIWESLDGIIDFTDDGEDPPAGEKRPIGFATADAVSDTAVTDEPNEDDVIPLDVLHRVNP